MWMFRVIGIVMMIGFTAMLSLAWMGSGVPVSPEDWAACIAVNMMCLVAIVVGGFMTFSRD